MAPQVGLEPTTDRLTADSSTTELLWNKKYVSLAASYSHRTSVQLPSALESLTTVFDMGTGVASPPSPPDFECIYIQNQIEVSVKSERTLNFLL